MTPTPLEKHRRKETEADDSHAIAGLLARAARSGPAGQEVEALFGAVQVGLRGYASVILIGVIASVVTGVVSRITVRRFLS